MAKHKKIVAHVRESGFEHGDSNFYSLVVLDDGCVYYTISSHDIDTHGRIYRYDPAAERLTLFADLGMITGESGKKSLPQGKSHTPLIETDQTIYITTHYGYYQGNQGKEEPAPPPDGYTPYPGGKIIAYDKASQRFDVIQQAPPEEGIITMNMDSTRGRMFCLTWPSGIFFTVDVASRSKHVVGPISRGGEIGLGDNYFCLCRVMGVDPRDGVCYMTNPDGTVLSYRFGDESVHVVPDCTMKRDVFGVWDPHVGGHQGYNWRQVLWHEPHQCFYGVHGKSGYLFRFEPRHRSIEVQNRICNLPCIRSGSYEHFRYGYMTMAFSPSNPTYLYYVSGYGTPGTDQARLHLTGYDLCTGMYEDFGQIVLEDGRIPYNTQTLAVHPNGRIYTCAWIHDSDESKKRQCDLIDFGVPDR